MTVADVFGAARGQIPELVVSALVTPSPDWLSNRAESWRGYGLGVKWTVP